MYYSLSTERTIGSLRLRGELLLLFFQSSPRSLFGRLCYQALKHSQGYGHRRAILVFHQYIFPEALTLEIAYNYYKTPAVPSRSYFTRMAPPLATTREVACHAICGSLPCISQLLQHLVACISLVHWLIFW